MTGYWSGMDFLVLARILFVLVSIPFPRSKRTRQMSRAKSRNHILLLSFHTINVSRENEWLGIDRRYRRRFRITSYNWLTLFIRDTCFAPLLNCLAYIRFTYLSSVLVLPFDTTIFYNIFRSLFSFFASFFKRSANWEREREREKKCFIILAFFHCILLLF